MHFRENGALSPNLLVRDCTLCDVHVGVAYKTAIILILTGDSGRLLIHLKTGHRRMPSMHGHPPIWLTTMDIIHQCLSLAPVPYLAFAFSALRFIWSSVEQAQACKRQLEGLSQSIAQFLQTINGEYHAGRLLESRTSTPLTDLREFVANNNPPGLGWIPKRTGYWLKSHHLFRGKPPVDSWSSFSLKNKE